MQAGGQSALERGVTTWRLMTATECRYPSYRHYIVRLSVPGGSLVHQFINFFRIYDKFQAYQIL